MYQSTSAITGNNNILTQVEDKTQFIHLSLKAIRAHVQLAG